MQNIKVKIIYYSARRYKNLTLPCLPTKGMELIIGVPDKNLTSMIIFIVDSLKWVDVYPNEIVVIVTLSPIHTHMKNERMKSVHEVKDEYNTRKGYINSLIRNDSEWIECGKK